MYFCSVSRWFVFGCFWELLTGISLSPHTPRSTNESPNFRGEQDFADFHRPRPGARPAVFSAVPELTHQCVLDFRARRIWENNPGRQLS